MRCSGATDRDTPVDSTKGRRRPGNSAVSHIRRNQGGLSASEPITN